MLAPSRGRTTPGRHLPLSRTASPLFVQQSSRSLRSSSLCLPRRVASSHQSRDQTCFFTGIGLILSCLVRDIPSSVGPPGGRSPSPLPPVPAHDSGKDT